ncbi:helix-turn-helix transcriptional regulator [Sediminivirga luteola]|uniref:Transcriptional regulator n=2 Tax=Sediminivirga luteola TaxID=1774748 RepID=A0A8J2U013_9MICO|nr:helix-turn-helix domain-containing protein [Sediminivirga luteola]GGA22518.1 hypothetical protein GCM10011333_26870 [Sediminivirga luteola]
MITRKSTVDGGGRAGGAGTAGRIGAGSSQDMKTRQRVFAAILEHGPIPASRLAQQMNLTPAAIRRHLDALVRAGRIEVRSVGRPNAGRGRPARNYVVTSDGHEDLETAYDELAVDVLGYLQEHAGEGAVAEFARRRMEAIERRVAPAVEAAGPEVAAKSRALGEALSREGYSASATPVAAGTPMEAMQLCQGHCPIQQVAAEFPEFCEVERESFARMLGVDVRRLSTLANGDHVCTTHIPTSNFHRPLLDIPYGSYGARTRTSTKEASGD